MNELRLSDGFSLSPVQARDKDAIVEHLQEPAIAPNTLTIPFPYSESDTETWINERLSYRQQHPREVTFAIRNPDGTLIGVIGIAGDVEIGSSHRAEVGYWLAKPYWGRGITTEALTRYAQYAFDELDVARLTAEVFVWNEASVRVLQNVGFKREGRLRRHREKNGERVDVFYFRAAL